jgi:O-methyltransferase
MQLTTTEPMGIDRASALYLDLLKRCLTDLIYINDPLSLMVPYRSIRRSEYVQYFLLSGMLAILRRFGVHAVRLNRQRFFDYSKLSLEQIAQLRAGGQDWPPRAHTMVGLKRLDSLQFCIETTLREGVEGDLMETGVWRGGASIFMKGVLAAYADQRRQVWLADSFRGLPPPDTKKYPADQDWDFHQSKELAVSQETVKANFAAYGLLDDRVHFLEGWFKDTLPNAPLERLAVLRLDGDLYESTIQVLEALYAKLSAGGFLIVDDYSLRPCRAAVTDFRRSHGIAEPIVDIDGIGAYWRKSGPERPRSGASV